LITPTRPRRSTSAADGRRNAIRTAPPPAKSSRCTHDTSGHDHSIRSRYICCLLSLLHRHISFARAYAHACPRRRGRSRRRPSCTCRKGSSRSSCRHSSRRSFTTCQRALPPQNRAAPSPLRDHHGLTRIRPGKTPRAHKGSIDPS